jgi:hypothetical protein
VPAVQGKNSASPLTQGHIAGEAGEVGSLDPRTNHEAINLELYLTSSRLSKLVLAGYGGASLLFFGLSRGTFVSPGLSAGHEAGLAQAVEASERQPPLSPPHLGHYSWWNLLLGPRTA